MQKDVSLKDVFLLFLKKFQQIFIVAVSVAVVFGCLGLWKGYQSSTDAEALQTAKDSYLVKLGEYNTGVQQLQQEIDTAEKQRQALMEYNENSLYFKLDSSQIAVKEIVFYVETDYQIMPNMVYQNPDKTSKIVSAYADAYQSDALYKGISQIIGEDIEEKYLDELIKVARAGDTKMVDGYGNVTIKHSDTNSSIVVLRAIHSNQEIANEMADFTFDFLQKNVQEKVAPHTVHILSSSEKTEIDENLKQLQEKNMKDLEKLSTTLTTKKASLSQKEKSIPVEPTISKMTVLKKGILYGVAGGVIGGVLICLWILVVFLTDSSLGDAKSVERMFRTEVFAIKGSGSKRKYWLNGLIRRLEGEQEKQLSHEDCVALTEANLRLLAKQQNMTHLLLTGTIELSEIQSFADHAKNNLDGIGIVYGESLLCSGATIDTLEKCDGVVLVENSRKSLSAEVDKEIKKILSAGKKVLGIILIEE